jgi:hypothetical protein
LISVFLCYVQLPRRRLKRVVCIFPRRLRRSVCHHDLNVTLCMLQIHGDFLSHIRSRLLLFIGCSRPATSWRTRLRNRCRPSPKFRLFPACCCILSRLFVRATGVLGASWGVRIASPPSVNTLCWVPDGYDDRKDTPPSACQTVSQLGISAFETEVAYLDTQS